MFSLYVFLCQVVQGKYLILQNTDDMSGTYGRGGPGGFFIPTEAVSAREVRFFSTVCVGDDEAPLTTGSLFVFKLVLLCPLVFEAFLQSECTPQTQILQVFGDPKYKWD